MRAALRNMRSCILSYVGHGVAYVDAWCMHAYVNVELANIQYSECVRACAFVCVTLKDQQLVNRSHTPGATCSSRQCQHIA